MPKLALFRRRYLPVPTLPGALLILLALGLPLYFLFTHAAHFLALQKPVGGELLVIEGWLGKNELAAAYRTFDLQGYRFAIVSGGPITSDFNTGPANYAERAREYLLSVGFPQARLTAVPAPYSAQERTFLSAVTVREWLSEQGVVIDSLDVFSADIHARRSRDLYRLAFGEEVSVGVYAMEPEDFELDRWWESSDTAKAVLAELLGWVFVKCCFDPGERGSHAEMRGDG